MGLGWDFLALHLLHQRHEAVGVESGTVELVLHVAVWPSFRPRFVAGRGGAREVLLGKQDLPKSANAPADCYCAIKYLNSSIRSRSFSVFNRPSGMKVFADVFVSSMSSLATVTLSVRVRTVIDESDSFSISPVMTRPSFVTMIRAWKSRPLTALGVDHVFDKIVNAPRAGTRQFGAECLTLLTCSGRKNLLSQFMLPARHVHGLTVSGRINQPHS